MPRQYAKGRHALGECQRSGKRVPYRDLVEDGHIPGLLVARDWWEPQHPQEIPPDMTDPVALHRPSPEISVDADEGSAELGGDGACASAPDTDYLATTTLAAALSVGATHVPLTDAVNYDFAQCIFIQRDDDTWYVSKATSTTNGSPQYTVELTTGVTLVGSGFSAGNSVYIGEDGNNGNGGVSPPAPTYDTFVMVLTESTGTERPRMITSDSDIETWTEVDFDADPNAPGGQIGDRYGLTYNGSDTWVTVGAYIGDGTGSGSIWLSENDGLTWQQGALNTPATIMYAVLWTGLFYTCWGEGGAEATTQTPSGTWTDLTTGSALDLVDATRYDNPANIAVGDGSGTGVVLVGANQTDQSKTGPWGAGDYFNAVASNGTRHFFGDNDGRMFWVDDVGPAEPTYTLGQGGVLSGAVRGIATDGADIVVAVGESTDVFVSTDNGVSFTDVSVLAAGGHFYDVMYDHGAGGDDGYGFVAVGAVDQASTRRAVIYTSADGLTWTLRYTSSTNASAARAVWSKNPEQSGVS